MARSQGIAGLWITVVGAGILLFVFVLVFRYRGTAPTGQSGLKPTDLSVDARPLDLPDLSALSAVQNLSRTVDATAGTRGLRASAEWLDLLEQKPEQQRFVLHEKELEKLLIDERATGSFADAIQTPFGTIESWSECNKIKCLGWVSILKGSEENIKRHKTERLPIPREIAVWPVDEIRVKSPRLVKNSSILLVEYSISEPPRGGLGSILHSYITMFGLPNLNVIWTQEISRSGIKISKESEERVGRCSWQVEVARSDFATLRVTENCYYTHCTGLDCNIKAEQIHLYKWDTLGRRFL